MSKRFSGELLQKRFVSRMYKETKQDTYNPQVTLSVENLKLQPTVFQAESSRENHILFYIDDNLV